MAAYLVVLHHAEQIRLKNDIFHLKGFSLFNNGNIAVSFFFVLSGFLISYLLLKERATTKDIAIRKFYTRRILRIWPLYFLLVFIGTVAIPMFISFINFSYEMPYTFSQVILYYVFFSPFMVNILFGHHLLEPLWSIGVEEIFYIMWAPLFKFIKKNQLIIILSVIGIKVALLLILPHLELPIIVLRIVKLLQFESMAIGALAAYLVFNLKKNIESLFIFSIPFQIVIVLFILSRIFALQYLSDSSMFFDVLFNSGLPSNVLLSCSFAWLIVNISVNKKSIVKLTAKVFNFLGDISYGIYMYHMLVVFGFILFFKKYLVSMSDLTSTVFFYAVITIGTIAISYLSKRYFEDYFLRLKSKFRLNK